MRQVALIYNATRTYDLQVVSGIAAYLQQGIGWNVYIEENALKDQRLPDLKSWPGDGVVANFDDPKVAALVLASGLPAVALGGGYGWYPPDSGIPYFFSNNRQIARLAADHLMDRGFRSFAYCGYPRTLINGWSDERARAFAERVRENGFPCGFYRGGHRNTRRWAVLQRSLRRWLEGLEKPVGVMAANDDLARQVLEACRAAGLQVPAEVAVIGVDNDEVLCGLSAPLLTSIEQGARRIGYEAAALLDRIMSGEKPARRCYIIDPVGVITRLSTDVLSVSDPKVANAAAYIHQHACEGITVFDVVNAVSSSRSGLEAHFRQTLGRTIHHAIREVQLDRARRLVGETATPLKQVAASTGFKSVQHMTRLFGNAFGQPPAKYRQTTRIGSPPAMAARKG